MGLMRRFGRHGQSALSPAKPAQRFNPLVIEAVEPRLLMASTSLTGHQAQNLAQGLHDNLMHFEAVLAAVEKTDIYTHSLPLIAGSDGTTPATLGSVTRFDSLLAAEIVAPIQAYISQIGDGTKHPATSADLAADLQSVINSGLGSSGSATVTDASDGTNIDLKFSFSTSVDSHFGLTLGTNTNVTGLTVPTDLQGTLKLGLSNFDFETVVSASSKVLTDSAVQATGAADLLDGFSLSGVSVHVQADAALKIPKGQEFDAGLLTLETTAPSSTSYSASLDTALSGTFSGATLNADAAKQAGSDFSFVHGLVTNTVDSNPNVVLSIPLSLSASDTLVPGLGSGFTGHIGFTGTVLDGNWSSQTVRDSGISLDTIQHFITLNPASIVAAFNTLDSYIGGLASSQLANLPVPFTHGLTVGSVLDFSTQFEKDIVDKLTPISNILGFTANQTSTAADGAHTASLIFTPEDLSSGALPASFNVTLTANGDVTSLALTNQYADAHGNLHSIASVDDLATAINQALAAAAAGSTLATVAGELAVAAINGNSETLSVASNKVTLGGTVKTGDKVQVTLTNSTVLSAGAITVSYTVTSADSTLDAVAKGLQAAINANADLKAANITATEAGGVITVATMGASTTKISIPDNAIELTASPSGNDLAPASIAINGPSASFTNIIGLVEELGQALGYGDAVTNIETFFTDLGFHYDAAANAIEFTLSYQTALDLGGPATETLTVDATAGTVTIGGDIHPGDTLDVMVSDPTLANGSQQVSYVVQSTDTLDSIAKGLSAAINGNSDLAAAGISATAAGMGGLLTVAGTTNTTLDTGANGPLAFDAGVNLGDIASLSGSGTLGVHASLGLTMTIGFSLDSTGGQADGAAITVDGKPLGTSTPVFDIPTLATTKITALTADGIAGTTGLADMQLILRDGTLATLELQHGQIVDHVGGAAPVIVQGTGTDTTSLNIGGTATAGDMVNVTVTYGSMKTDTLTTTVAATDTPSSIAAAIASAINADSTLHMAGVTASAAANTISLGGKAATISATLVGASGHPASETIDQQAITLGDLLTAFNDIKSGNMEVTVGGAVRSGNLNVTIGGDVHAGDTVGIVLTSAILGEEVAVSYTVKTGDTAADIAAGLKAAINANSVLQTASIAATYNAGDTFLVTGQATVLTAPQSATISVTPEEDVTLGGSVTAGDVMSLMFTGGALGTKDVAVTYIVQAGDTLADAAAGLQGLINENSQLNAAGISAMVAKGAPDSIVLTGNPTVTVGAYSTALNETGAGGLVLSGMPHAGDILAVSVKPTGGTKATAAYTVQQGDTLDDMIAKLAVAIDKVSPTVGDSVEGVVTGADSISVAGDRYLVDNGGDISLSVFPLPGAKLNFAVDGHQLSVTVRQGYSQPEDVIAAIVDAINDAALPGVSASLSATITGATLGAPAAPTETITTTPNVDTLITGGGDAAVGSVLSLAVTPTGAMSATTVNTTLQFGQSVADGLAHLADKLDNLGMGVTASLTGTVTGGTLSNPGGDVSDGGDSFYVSNNPTGVSTITVNGVTISYTAQPGDTAADVIAALMDEINANTTLHADGVTGDVSVTAAGGTVAVSTAGAETVSTADAPATGPGLTTGDVLTLVFDSTNLSAPEAVTYVVMNNDTIATIAAGLKAAINADAKLTGAGITATTDATNPDALVIAGNPSVTQNPGTLTLAADHNGDLTLGGTVQVGDVLALKVTPTTGPNADKAAVASYTVQAGDTRSDAYAKLLDAIEGVDATISATVTGTVDGAKSIVTPNTGDNATDLNDTGDVIEVMSGHAGDHLSVIVNGETINYTVVAGHTTAQDIVAGLMNAINAAGLKGVSASMEAIVAHANLAVPLGATETLTVAPSVGGISAIYNSSTMQIELHDGTLASGINPTGLGFTEGASGASVVLTSAPTGAVSASNYYQSILLAQPSTLVDYSGASNFLLTLGKLAPIEISIGADSHRTTAADFADAVNAALAKLTVDPTELGLPPGITIGLGVGETTGHAGDLVTATIHNSDLTGGELAVSYTVKAGDTASTIATGLAAAINGTKVLADDGISATASGTTVTVATLSGTSTVTGSADTTAETIAASSISYGKLIAATGDAFTVEGAPKTGDVIKLHVVVNGSGSDITYTVKAGDTGASIATGLATAMQTISGVNAASSSNTVMFSSAAGNTITVTNSSAATNSEVIQSSLTFATTTYNVVSASAANMLQGLAAKFGLTINSVDTTLFALNGSTLVSNLGFTPSDVNGLDAPTGLLTSGSLYNPTIGDRFFFTDTAIVGDLDLEATDLKLAGMLGFIGFQATGSAYVHLEAKFALQSPTGADFLTFHQLSDALTNNDLSSLWAFTVAAPDGGNWADLTIDNVKLVGGNTAGNVISDLGNALVQPMIEVAFNNDLTSISDFLHAKPQVTVTGFDSIKGLKDLSFSDIVAGLQQILMVIDNDTGSSILDTTIPIVGVSINDVLNYAQDFATFLDQLSKDPSGTVAQINTMIQAALGPLGSNVNLSYSNGALMLALDFSTTVTKALPFSIDLATLAADAGVTLPSEVTDLVGVDANGTINLTAGADLGVSLGIQLKAPGATTSTSLSSVNKGKGIATDGKSTPDLVITTGSNYQFSVDLNALTKTDTATVDAAAKTITVGGTATAGETLSFTVDNAKLDGKGAAGSGTVTVVYTVIEGDTAASIASAINEIIAGNSALTKAGITASVSDHVVTLAGADTIAGTVGGTVGELLDTINTAATAAGLGAGFATLDANGDVIFTDAATQVAAAAKDAEQLGFAPHLELTGANGLTVMAMGGLTATVDGGAVTVTGTPAAGNSVSLTLNGHTVSYTVQTGDDLTAIDTHLATLISALSVDGLSAKVVGQAATTVMDNAATIGGTVVTGDTVTLTVSYGSGKTEMVTYTAVAGDTVQTIADGLAKAINADTALHTAGVVATATGASVSVVAATGTATLAGQVGGMAMETVTIGATDLVAASGTVGSPGSAYSVNLVFGDKTATLSIGADMARTTTAELVDAINQQLAATAVDLGIVNPDNAGNNGTLSNLVGAVLQGSTIAFVGAQAVLGETTAFAVANLPAGPLGLSALGFSGSTNAMVANAVETISTTVPANIDFTKEYTFQLVVNGTAATIDIKADSTRTTADAFVRALNLTLGGTFMDQKALGLGTNGKTILGHLVNVTDTVAGGTTTLTFTANDSTLGTLHKLSIQDVPGAGKHVLSVRDLNGSGSAEALGFAAANQNVTAAMGDRVLTGSQLTDNAGNHLFFIDTANTGVTFKIAAAATDLNFSTNIGPLSIDIKNGSAILGAEKFVNGVLPLATDKAFAVSATDPGTLHFGLKDGVGLNEKGDALKAADRLYFSEISGSSGERTVRIGGADTTGDTVTLTIKGAKLTAPETVSYKVAAGDTDIIIAGKLAAAINADAKLTAAQITASTAPGSDSVQIFGSTGVTGTVTAVPATDPAKPNKATEKLAIVNGYGNILSATSNIAIQVSLPVYFLGQKLDPTVQIGIGNLLGGPSGNAIDPNPWSLNIPDLSKLISSLESSFNAFSFLNNPEAVINGLNGLLGALDTIFTQQLFGYKLPLVGSALSDAGDFIGSLRSTLIGDLNGLVDDYKSAHNGQDPTTAGIVMDAVNQLTASLGFSGGITITVDAPNKEIDFALDLTKMLFNGTVNLSSDIGIPGLGISVQNGAVGFALNTDINLNFVYSSADGFYLLPSAAGKHAIDLGFAVTIPSDFSVELTLGILELTGVNGSHVFSGADNTTSTGTSLKGGVFVDLHSKTSDGLADLGSTTSQVVATDAGGNQTISVTLPTTLDTTSAYAFQLIVDGTAVTVNVAADSGRTHASDLVTAINSALGQAMILKSAVDSTNKTKDMESLSDLGVTATLSGGALVFSVADAKLGGKPSLALADTHIAFSKIGSNLRAEIAANFDLDLQLTAHISGGGMSLPSITTEMLFAYQLDKVFVGTDNLAQTGVLMPFTFKDVTLDMGQFLSGFLEPILNTADQLLSPIKPLLDFITAPLPGISDILHKSTSLLDIAGLLGGSNKDIATIVKVVTIINEVEQLISSIKAMSSGGELLYDFGTFMFGKATVGPLSMPSAPAMAGTNAGPSSFDPFGTDKLSGVSLNVPMLGSLSPTASGSNSSQMSALKQVNGIQKDGAFSLPILKDPISLLELLLGQTTHPVTLFEWKLPTVSFTFSSTYKFPLLGFGPFSLNALLGLGFNIGIHVAFGYDTEGYTEFKQTGNAFYLADGFFVDDTLGPQLTLGASITAGAELDLAVVDVSLTGTIGANIGFTLFDPNGDGKVRPSEILSELEGLHNPLDLFVVSGDIYARVDLNVFVGLDLGFFKITLFQHDFNFVNAVLYSFTLTPPVHPVLSTMSDDGTLTLNTGSLADQRLVGNTGTSGDQYMITGNGGGSYTITSNGTTQNLTGVKKITADTGDGDANITLRNVDVPVSITGGNGNNVIDTGGANDGTFTFGNGNNTIIGTNAGDTITVGDGNNTIIDGDGADTITAGNGNNYIDGGAGNDRITVGNGNNTIVGGKGDNTIITGTGNNVVIGGQATSIATTFTNGGVTYNVFGADPSGKISNAGVTGDGNNTITTGNGDNIVLGGTGADTITVTGAGDNFVVGDIGTATVTSAAAFASTGNAAVVSIAATGTVGGNDTIDAHNAFGDNVLLGGAGDDMLLGGSGTNVILGDNGSVAGPAGGISGQFTITATPDATGNDTIIGGVGVDVLIGGPGNDTINGNAGNDIIAGDDATVVRTAAIGATANLVSATEIADGATGNDILSGGTGDDIVLGGGGNDMIDGGSGNNLLLGDYGKVDFSVSGQITVTGKIDTVGMTDGADMLTGGDGNNLIMGGGGADTMTAGNGNDIFFGDAGQAVFRSADYSVITAQTVDEAFGAADNIVLTGTGTNVVLGGAGDDNIALAGPNNNIVLGDFGTIDESVSGLVTVTGRDGNVGTFHDGNDLINLLGGVLNITGTATAGDVVTAKVAGQTLTYTAIGGDTTATIATALAARVNANATLSAAGITATTSNGSLLFTGAPTLTGSDTGGTLGFAATAGATGNNIVMGGGAADTINIYGGGNNIAFGDSGTVNVASTNFAVMTTSTTDESNGGNDQITILGGGNNVAAGGAGNDTILINGPGSDIALGDLGSIAYTGSTLVVSSHDATSDTNSTAYSAADTITIGAGATGADVVMGGAGNDTITVNANGNNDVLGDSGSANITVSAGGAFTLNSLTTVDTSPSGEESIGGNDAIIINGSGNNAVAAGAGNDTISVLGTGNNIVLGDLGSITFTGAQLVVSSHDAASDTGNANYVAADTITIGANASGSNIAMGGAGTDSIIVNANGNNYALGDSGSANLTVGSGGSFTLNSLTTVDTNANGEESIGGNDTITINGNGNNAVAAGAGNDIISIVGTGNNIALGDLGSITYSGGGVVVSSHDAASDTGNANYAAADTITVGAGASGSNIAMGGAGNDTITINANGNNYVLGDSGTANLTVGAAGDFTLQMLTTIDTNAGGEESIGGDDLITINGNGNNAVAAGAGKDKVSIVGTGNNIALGDLGSITYSTNTVVVSSHDAASDTGTATYSADDTITIGAGASGSNIAMGGAGNDTINVNANGNNYILGDSGTANLQVGTGGSFTLNTLTTVDTNPNGEEAIGGNDLITINGNGNNAVAAGAGNDIVSIIGTGNNIALGDLGTIVYSGSQVTVTGHDAASDTGNANYAAADIINIGAGASGSNIVMGGAGNDIIGILANGNNYAFGDSGTTNLSVAATGAFTLQSLTTFDGNASGEESIGGNDAINVVGNGNNAVVGGAGNDIIGIIGTGNNIALGDLGSVVYGGSQVVIQSHDAASDTGKVNYAAADIINIGAGAAGSNVVMGGAGNDQIGVLSNGNNFVLGDSGVATLSVLADNSYRLGTLTTTDNLASGEESIGGSDTIVVLGDGSNIIEGGAGNDTIEIDGTGNNVALGDLGVVTLQSDASLLVAGHDTASDTGNASYAAADSIFLGARSTGNNVIMGGAGADGIGIVGSGNNEVLGDSGQAVIDGWYSAPVLRFLTTVDPLGNGEEQIGGNDTISVLGNGTNHVMGGNGQDTINLSGNGNNYLLGDFGVISKTTVGGITGYNVVGHGASAGNGNSSDNDTITVLPTATGNNVVMGGGGADKITIGGYGLYNHYGNNVVFGDDGSVILSTTAYGPVWVDQTVDEPDGGDDTIIVTGIASGDNRIFGGQGSDTIDVFGAGDNTILGDMGLIVPVNGLTDDVVARDTAIGAADTITLELSAAGNNLVEGEAGGDRIMANGEGLNVITGDSALVTRQMIGDRIYPKHVLSNDIGIGGDDTITATHGTNFIIGGTGADVISGGDGNDAIIGDDGEFAFGEFVYRTLAPTLMQTTHFEDGGNDIISTGDGLFNYAMGGTGADRITGGYGADMLAGDQALITWNYFTGEREFFTTVGSTPTSSANDVIYGGPGPDDLLGGEGSDYLNGGPGSDIIMGDDGHIIFNGNTEKFAETITPFSPGADTLVSSGGHDFLFGGGPQNNLFVADPLNDMIYNTDGRVDIQGGTSFDPLLQNPPIRTGEWSMPPFMGNSIVSSLHNWFSYTQPLDLDTQPVLISSNFYERSTTLLALDELRAMGVGGDYARAVTRGDHYPAPVGLSVVTAIEAVAEGRTGILAPSHAIGGSGDGVLGTREVAGDSIVLALDAYRQPTHGFVFDAQNGVWVEDVQPATGPVLDLMMRPTPVIDFAEMNEILLAAE